MIVFIFHYLVLIGLYFLCPFFSSFVITFLSLSCSVHHFCTVNVSNGACDISRDLPDSSACFHLHDIIQNTPITGSFDLFKDHHITGEIHLDLTFSYGTFGYGYSYHLLPTQNKGIGEGEEANFGDDTRQKLAENLDNSLFPR